MNDKVHKAMRSLFRLNEFKEMHSPSILIDKEMDLLQKYLLNLDSTDILYLVKNFSTYFQSTRTESAADDERFAQEIERQMKALN